MVKLDRFIKNSDFDASYQILTKEITLNIPAGKVSNATKFTVNFEVPPGEYISDCATRVRPSGEWKLGVSSKLYADGEYEIGDVRVQSFILRRSPTEAQAGVYCAVFGGGQSKNALPQMTIDFAITLSVLPV